MNEEEANDLIAEVGKEVEEAISQWGLHGGNNSPGGIHQIFTRDNTSEGEGGLIPNKANWTGIVGHVGTQPHTLKFRDPSEEEYAEPNLTYQPRFDGSFLRHDVQLDFSQEIDEFGAVSMRIFISDPWGEIDSVNCAEVTDPGAFAGGRPFLTIPNDGNQYAIFKTAGCTRVKTSPAVGDIPVEDTLSTNKFTYELYQRSFSTDWMPLAPDYTLVSSVPPVDTYSGAITTLFSGFTCMGYHTTNIAPEGEPEVLALCFIVAEESFVEGPELFRFSETDFTEYYTKGFDVFDAPLFDRFLVPGIILAGYLTGGGRVPTSSLAFECP